MVAARGKKHREVAVVADPVNVAYGRPVPWEQPKEYRLGGLASYDYDDDGKRRPIHMGDGPSSPLLPSPAPPAGEARRGAAGFLRHAANWSSHAAVAGGDAVGE